MDKTVSTTEKRMKDIINITPNYKDMRENNYFKTILLVMVLGVAQWVSAQGMSVATLQHGDQMKAFYGLDAFVEAMEEAVAGDLISLSSGNFNPPEVIEKAVVIQGAGMYLNDWNTSPTYINGSIEVALPEEACKGLMLEGLSMAHDCDIQITSNVENLCISKCKVRHLDFADITATDVLLDRCYIGGTLQTGSEADGGLVVRNSYIGSLHAENSNASNRTFTNCVINETRPSGWGWSASSCSGIFENNVIRQLCTSANSSYYNNIFQWIENPDPNEYGSLNRQVDMDEDGVFAVGSFPGGENSDAHLSEAAAAEYLGTDGTQVGMYGGATPFTIVPSSPQVTSSEVAPYSDANGKLNVKITVEAGSN